MRQGPWRMEKEMNDIDVKDRRHAVLSRSFSTEEGGPRLWIEKIMEHLRLPGNASWDNVGLNRFLKMREMSTSLWPKVLDFFA